MLGDFLCCFLKTYYRRMPRLEWPRLKNQKADQRNKKGNPETYLKNCNEHCLHGTVTITNKNKQKNNFKI